MTVPPALRPEDRPTVKPPKPLGKRLHATARRWQTLNLFVDRTLASLRPAEVRVWIVLYRHTRAGKVRVSRARIAQQTGMSEGSVSKALAKLMAIGLVIRLRKGNSIHHTLSTYRIRGVRRRQVCS